MTSGRLFPSILVLFCSLVNVEHVSSACVVRDLRVEALNATSIRVEWRPDFDCPDVHRQLHVHVRRLGVKACPSHEADDQRPSETRVLSLSSSSSEVLVSLLSPFSLYEVSIVQEPEDEVLASTTTSTPSTWPEAAPEAPRGFKSAQAFTQAIRFVWSNDEAFQRATCHLRNGLSDGFRAELWGKSEWLKSGEKPIEVFHVSDFLNELYVQNLRPFSTYALRVFLNNVGNVYNEHRYLEIVATTTAAKKLHPPSIIALESMTNTMTSNPSLRVHWMPPYPPLGPVSGYVVRVGSNESTLASDQGQVVWQRRIQVDNKTVCEYDVQWPHCLLIEGLSSDTFYVVQIQSESQISSQSDFSNSFVLRTPETRSQIEDDQSNKKSNSDENNSDKNKNIDDAYAVALNTTVNVALPQRETSTSLLPTFSALLLISALILLPLTLALILLAYKLKVRQLKLRLSNQSKSLVDFDTLGASSRSFSFLSSQHTATSSIWGDQATNMSFCSTTRSIQSRRLPEPPVDASDNAPRRHAYEQVVEGDKGPKEVTDTYGYLRPTFNKSFGSHLSGLDVQSRLVPVRSYTSVHCPPDQDDKDDCYDSSPKG